MFFAMLPEGIRKLDAETDCFFGFELVNLKVGKRRGHPPNSTELAINNQNTAAEVVTAYLMGTTRIIRALGGDIRSFDGHRVMGIFFEGTKNTLAAEAALKINDFKARNVGKKRVGARNELWCGHCVSV